MDYRSIDETSRISSLDLYEDLLLNDSKQGQCLTIKEINVEKKQLEEQNQLLHQQLSQTTASLTSLKKQYEILEGNFESLLQTAKHELERKNKVISRLTGTGNVEPKNITAQKSVYKKSFSSKGIRADESAKDCIANQSKKDVHGAKSTYPRYEDHSAIRTSAQDKSQTFKHSLNNSETFSKNRQEKSIHSLHRDPKDRDDNSYHGDRRSVSSKKPNRTKPSKDHSRFKPSKPPIIHGAKQNDSARNDRRNSPPGKPSSKSIESNRSSQQRSLLKTGSKMSEIHPAAKSFSINDVGEKLPLLRLADSSTDAPATSSYNNNRLSPPKMDLRHKLHTRKRTSKLIDGRHRVRDSVSPSNNIPDHTKRKHQHNVSRPLDSELKRVEASTSHKKLPHNDGQLHHRPSRSKREGQKLNRICDKMVHDKTNKLQQNSSLNLYKDRRAEKETAKTVTDTKIHDDDAFFDSIEIETDKNSCTIASNQTDLRSRPKKKKETYSDYNSVVQTTEQVQHDSMSEKLKNRSELHSSFATSKICSSDSGIESATNNKSDRTFQNLVSDLSSTSLHEQTIISDTRNCAVEMNTNHNLNMNVVEQANVSEQCATSEPPTKKLKSNSLNVISNSKACDSDDLCRSRRLRESTHKQRISTSSTSKNKVLKQSPNTKTSNIRKRSKSSCSATTQVQISPLKDTEFLSNVKSSVISASNSPSNDTRSAKISPSLNKVSNSSSSSISSDIEVPKLSSNVDAPQQFPSSPKSGAANISTSPSRVNLLQSPRRENSNLLTNAELSLPKSSKTPSSGNVILKLPPSSSSPPRKKSSVVKGSDSESSVNDGASRQSCVLEVSTSPSNGSFSLELSPLKHSKSPLNAKSLVLEVSKSPPAAKSSLESSPQKTSQVSSDVARSESDKLSISTNPCVTEADSSSNLMNENAVLPSCTFIKDNDKLEISRSYMDFYRNTSLQYLLHLAKETLSKRKETNNIDDLQFGDHPFTSRQLWLKSLDECQVRRKLNNRWLSEKGPDSSSKPHINDSCSLTLDLHSSATSSSWMLHEDSMKNFVDGLMIVVTPLKSLKKNSERIDTVIDASQVASSAKRKVLQSPNK